MLHLLKYQICYQVTASYVELCIRYIEHNTNPYGIIEI